MPNRTIWVIVTAAISLVVAGAGAAVYYQGSLEKAPDRSPGAAGNQTNATNATHTDQLATDGGGHMTMSILLVGTMFVETDVKDHYTMPAGKKKVAVNISWDRTGWDLNLAIGTGDCPDNGVVLASQSNVQSGPVTLEFKATGEALEEGQWFVHAACNDPSSHRGESVTFSYTVAAKSCC